MSFVILTILPMSLAITYFEFC